MLNRQIRRSFGLVQDYHRRLGKKLNKGYSLEEHSKFFTTASRPGNFGEHVELKTNVDNWFEDNRIYNEADTDVKRTQVYLLNALYFGGVLSFARMFTMGIIGRLSGWKRYDRDTYMEYDISDLPPGEVMQVVWNGEPVFVRRLTNEEKAHEESAPLSLLLDKNTNRQIIDDVNNSVLVCSATCTHLGCIPIPYLGAYKGWVCICHGSVFDKLGRVRQGPALDNLPILNNSLYGSILCIEELKYPREPSERFWA